MNEQELFLSALEINDPAERQAHVQAACADNPELLTRVESLLASHESQSLFLNKPIVDQMVDEPVNKPDATLLFQNGSTQDDEFETADFNPQERDAMTQNLDELSDEIPLGYLEPSSREDSLGRLGHYEILEVIGSGAFGTVLKAFDEKLHRIVAIKVLSPQMAATSPARKRFLREARSSAAVRHDNVVSVYAVEDEPIPYLVMEYIPGQTLQQRLDGTGPLNVETVLRLGKQIADGLAAAHAQDLIHRDIKPGNILLDNSVNDHVKITDFGLARTADDASMTQSGMIAGTPLYMAPEQAQGQKLDQRADLFSFGSVLYQMLSGRPPFRASNTVAVLKRVVDDTPRPIKEIIPEVPGWMCELIGHLHAKNPDERYSSAKEVSDLLAQCLADVKEGRKPRIPAPETADTVLRPALFRQPRDTALPRKGLLGRIAVVALVMLVGLGLTELTGVTTLVSTIKGPATNSGMLVVDGADHGATVIVNGNVPGDPTGLTSQTRTRPEPIDWPADAPPLATAPFDADQAKQHQQAWADYLGVPLEKEIDLGRDKHGLDVKLSMVLIPPGDFLMGSNDEEIAILREQATADGLRPDDLKWIELEGPQRRVRITRPFYLSRNEFSTGQFRIFVEDASYTTEAESSGKGAVAIKDGKLQRDPDRNWSWAGKRPQGPANPVVNVTWNDAGKCCEWLSGLDADLTFALPTEAQWEFACRAGTTTAWFSGDDQSAAGDYAWLSGAPWWPKEVGQKLPNAFGLYDMHGNVWEWCRDSFHNYRDAGDVDPVGVADGEKRMIRGGNCYNGWSADDWNVKSGSRSAVRLERSADDPFMDRGFRVSAAISDGVFRARRSGTTAVAASELAN